MIASWMAYAGLLGVLVTLAAVAVEHVAVARRWPARVVWVAALGLSIAWPVGESLRRYWLQARTTADVMPFAITVLPAQVITAASGPTRAEWIDRALLVCWIVASLFLLARLSKAVIGLRHARGGWRRDEVDGVAVRLAPNEGPAVVGLRSMEIVLPEWIVALDTHLRALVLRHEDEHRRARDPYVLFAAAVLVALMPWNLALWFQARRLRLAIELDCDARVLRAHPSAERYGLLMMTIAQRRSVAPTLFAPMLTEPATQLERRILAMSTTTRRVARATLYGGAVASIALLFACSLRSDSVTGPGSPGATRTATANGAPKRVTDSMTFVEFQVEKPAQPVPGNAGPRYPDLLRNAGVDGQVVAQFVVDTSGRPDMLTFRVVKSTHDLFTASVRATLPNIRFYPAEVGNRKVKQLIQMPFDFSMGQGTGQLGTVVVTALQSPSRNPTVASTSPVRVVGVPPRGAAATIAPPGTYLEYQVSKAVSPRPGNRAPRYPDALRQANVEGEVLAQFVVDENGVADTASFRVLRSTHDLFSITVRDALSGFRFYPAELDGRPVKQVVQMPFQFSLAK
jgi:TonB family protein